ncbi:hypothetical protein ACIBKZ_15685 [Streptomyces sp. NPDC050421]|uniref:hypothetical protein n=1 Tax=Streptomyces sp. NPDC050421 TaxID=3365613 RepID=UPI00379E0D2D
MLNLTAAQIDAARNNDLDAVTAVIAETEERVMQLAHRYATTGGHTDVQLKEDMAQVGRTEVWLSLATFEGSSVAEFFTYFDTKVSGMLSNERRKQTRQGVSEATARRFEKAVAIAGGDPYAAEHVATDGDEMGTFKLSPEMANAARLSWQGIDSLDAPAGDMDADDEHTVGDSLEATYGIPGEYVTAADITSARRRETTKAVHATLDKMGKQAADILRGMVGIDPVPYFGADFDDELAEYVGCARTQVRANRTKAKARFAAIYVKGANA